jgi:phage gp36-like protein
VSAGAYIQLEDLKDAFGDDEVLALTDRNQDGQADPDFVDGVIESAESEMNGYFVGGGYAVPIQPVSGVVKRIALNIARHYLYTDAEPETVANLYKSAVAWLKAVSRGDVKIGATSEGETPATDGNETTIQSAKNVFARSAAGGCH